MTSSEVAMLLYLTLTYGYCDLPVLSRDSELQMLEALAQQPVAVGVNIHALQFYESGIVQMADCPPADSNPLKVGPDRCCSPRHPTHCKPSFLELCGILISGEQHLTGPSSRRSTTPRC